MRLAGTLALPGFARNFFTNELPQYDIFRADLADAAGMKIIPSLFYRALAALLIVPALLKVGLVTSTLRSELSDVTQRFGPATEDGSTPKNQDTPALAFSLPGHSDHDGSPLESAALAQTALCGGEAASMAACEKLRTLGPAGLDALFQAWEAAAPPEKETKFRQFCLAVDRVSRQKDDRFSRLFWHNDLEQAKAEARRSGKPILSLWMLGNLGEEYSCANSRFFRAMLYSNREISELLRSHFVLHWHSVRPAPRVTIDFGDGRKLSRTLTGNSIHYILNEQGEPVDALPGLYTPAEFSAQLQRTLAFLEQSRGLDRQAFSYALRAWHRARLGELDPIIQEVAGAAGLEYIQTMRKETVAVAQTDLAPTAVAAMPRAISKMVVEKPLLHAIVPAIARQPAKQDGFWLRLGQRDAARAGIDANSQALMREKYAVGLKGEVLPGWDEMFRHVQELATADGYWNEFMLRPAIHQWLAANSLGTKLPALNEYVYSALFLTPSSDPWLGLAPTEFFSALPNEGAREQ